MKKRINKICSILLVIGIIYLGYSITYNIYFKIYREKVVENYLVNKDDIDNIKYSDILGILEIPSINLKQAVYKIDSDKNDVDKNVEILKESRMPDIEGSNLYLAGHSGNRKEAYFNDLDKLKADDYIYFYYNNKKYTYKINKIYTEIKDGNISIEKDNWQKIILTTCSKNKGYQLVVVAILESHT